MTYATKNNLIPAADYPYTGDNGSCKQSQLENDDIGMLSDVITVELGSVSQLKAAVSKGPVAVGIVGDTTLEFYESGVLTSCAD